MTALETQHKIDTLYNQYSDGAITVSEWREGVESLIKLYAKHFGRDIRHKAAEIAVSNTEFHRDIMNIQTKPE